MYSSSASSPAMALHFPPFIPFLSYPDPLPSHILKPLHAAAIRSASGASSSLLLSLHPRLVLSAAAASLFPYAIRLLLHPSLPIPSTSFSWNSLLRHLAFSRNLQPMVLTLFVLMLLHSAPPPDKHSFPIVLKACAHFFLLREGSQIHSYLLKLGFSSDTYVANSLIHFYSSCGYVHTARKVFDGMTNRTKVSWNVIIDCYSVSGDYNTALYLFRSMQLELLMPDVYTIQSLLCACGGLGALSLGMWVHAFLLNRLDSNANRPDILVSNSLVDLYSRCGSISMARQVFNAMPERDVASWNTMILGLATHGHIMECFDAFQIMIKEDNLRPNSITFVAILCACNHGGLAREGLQYFGLFTDKFHIEPLLEHYGCLVDMLARSGMIDEAIDCVQSMPWKPDAVIWRSLLDACCKRKARLEVSESVAQLAIGSDAASDGGVYVLLSRVYASANRWNDVGLVRKLMVEGGIKKEPGCSSIEIDGIVHEFVAGDTSHPKSKEIYKKLEEVERRILSIGYEFDPMQAPMVAGKDSVKKDSLRLHSERLAMAFGLLNASPGAPIRILKNLRVCGDCHNVAKLISRVYDVEIVLRDRLRFHYFQDGFCSCMDYW